MADKVKIPFTQVQIGRFLFLLISLLLLFVLRPFLEGYFRINLLIDIFMTVILLSGIYAVSNKKKVLYICLAIAIPTLVSHWVSYFIQIPFLFLVGIILGVVFYSFMIITILGYIFKEKNITSDVIFGSICVYLLLGVLWAGIFSIMETLAPGSFQTPEDMGAKFSHFSYFSFVTMTTLGYGDITPLSSPARSLAVLEAVTGQLYIAVLVARLVGIQIAQSMKRES